jgi:superfamily II DNA/RNA helicase
MDGLKGMDVPNIELVIQWRATCHLATLWQHFGRAVRNKELMGTALLLAEKEHFEEEQEARAIRKTQCDNARKQKATDSLAAQNNKCHAVIPSESPANSNHPSTSAPQADNEDSVIGSVNSGLQELKDAMVNTYQELNKAGVNSQAAKRKKKELDLGIDYLINANQWMGLMCRRKVFNVCFDNEAAGENFQIQLNWTALMPKFQTLTTLTATQSAFWAVHAA